MNSIKMIIRLITFLVLSIAILIGTPSAFRGKKGSIFFYNPETNIDNYASLKAMLDQYLSSYGDIKFQPFNKKNIFEEMILKTYSPTILIVSSWHYRSLREKASLTPALIARRNGKSTYKKILSVRKPFSKVESLAGKTIASSGSREYTLSLLKKMVRKDQYELLSKIKLLRVSKDIDALISVGFGIAEAALTTEASLNAIKRTNPKLKKKISRLLVSDDILMPIVVIINHKGFNETCEELTKIIKNMSNTESGKENLSLLSVEEWSVIPKNIVEILNK